MVDSAGGDPFELPPEVQKQLAEMLERVIGPVAEAAQKVTDDYVKRLQPQLEAVFASLRPQIQALSVSQGAFVQGSSTVHVGPHDKVGITDSVFVELRQGLDIPSVVATAAAAMVTGALAMAINQEVGALWIQQLQWLQTALWTWAVVEWDRLRRGG